MNTYEFAVHEIMHTARECGLEGEDGSEEGWGPCPRCGEHDIAFYARPIRDGDSHIGLFYCRCCGAGGHRRQLWNLQPVEDQGA